MEQTAVEWLYETLWKQTDFSLPNNILEQAKEMEKEQMHKCASFWRGKENAIEKAIFEQYYNETFKK